jgi:hypothetical protein
MSSLITSHRMGDIDPPDISSWRRSPAWFALAAQFEAFPVL